MGFMDPVTVVCIKQGNKYNATYANNLLAGVAVNLTIPHRLLCITDDPEDVTFETAPLEGPYRGWWSKISLFKSGAYNLMGPVLYFDLDTIILRNIDQLATLDTDFAILKDFTRPDRYGSGVMKFTAGKHSWVWDNFNKEHQERIGIYGDQEWIWEQVKHADYFPVSWCASYKLHCQPTPPTSAKVVCFHGDPKPHEVLSGWVPIMWHSAYGQGVVEEPKLHTPAPVRQINWTTGAGLETFLGCGQVRYVCPEAACTFDSYSPQLLHKHWSVSHKGATAPMPTLFDGKGNQIVRDVHAPIIFER